MPDYSKGKIYTIRCRTDKTLIYVGSTIQPLSVRLGGHKVRSRDVKYQNMLIYKTINNNWNDWYIELYEEYPCENKEQLCRREGEIIREIGTLNVVINGRTREEYFAENKEIVANKFKIYYQNNREIKLEYRKIYREEHKESINKQKAERITCECGCILRRYDITRHKKSLKHIQLLENI